MKKSWLGWKEIFLERTEQKRIETWAKEHNHITRRKNTEEEPWKATNAEVFAFLLKKAVDLAHQLPDKIQGFWANCPTSLQPGGHCMLQQRTC